MRQPNPDAQGAREQQRKGGHRGDRDRPEWHARRCARAWGVPGEVGRRTPGDHAAPSPTNGRAPWGIRAEWVGHGPGGKRPGLGPGRRLPGGIRSGESAALRAGKSGLPALQVVKHSKSIVIGFFCVKRPGFARCVNRGRSSGAGWMLVCYVFGSNQANKYYGKSPERPLFGGLAGARWERVWALSAFRAKRSAICQCRQWRWRSAETPRG